MSRIEIYDVFSDKSEPAPEDRTIRVRVPGGVLYLEPREDGELTVRAVADRGTGEILVRPVCGNALTLAIRT